MPVLSIVACRMLEDELVYLLSADREIRELLLVDRVQALSLSAKLKGQNLRQCGGFLADLETSWARIKSLNDLLYAICFPNTSRRP